MSTTPRTQSEVDSYDGLCLESVDADFARQLETELNAANARLAELESQRDNWRVSSVCREQAARIAELDQELAMSKSQFESMAVAFTDNQRRLAELEQDKARLDHMDAITQPKGFRGHIDAAMGGYK
jgi:multidrug efflux pump subunit AcrA (membrane-fusion protein)